MKESHASVWWKVGAAHNTILGMRDCLISQGGYGPLPESHLDISFGQDEIFVYASGNYTPQISYFS
ncbi:MAG: hypothetical protein ACXQTW_00880 [Candidatus Methanospirareceae archaeon]